MTSPVPAARGRDRGQILAIFAASLIFIMGLGALAIDVTSVYASRQAQRSLADAAALAGAQDLQRGSRGIPADGYRRARLHAVESIAGSLGIPTPSCPFSANLVDCAVGPYLVTVKTPSPSYLNVDPDHAVQVTVRRVMPLTFARALGQKDWNVRVTSVAGLYVTARYALVTLRPPSLTGSGSDSNANDIDLNGTDTTITVKNGDVLTNTNALTNSGSQLVLDDGYLIDHYGAGELWNKVGGFPEGNKVNTLFPDPAYLDDFPNLPNGGADRFATMEAGVVSCASAPGAPPAGAICYAPGKYEAKFTDNQNKAHITYLMPGAYFFLGGLDISGTLIGGDVTGGPGVFVWSPRTQTVALNNAESVRLNAGPVGCETDACRSGPARLSNGVVLTTGDGLILTMAVERASTCFDANHAPKTASPCVGSSVLNIPGNGQLRIAGITYAPTDRVVVSGNNSGSEGVLGQLISWTVTVQGGAKLRQSYPGIPRNGVLHLDAACSGGGTLCNE